MVDPPVTDVGVSRVDEYLAESLREFQPVQSQMTAFQARAQPIPTALAEQAVALLSQQQQLFAVNGPIAIELAATGRFTAAAMARLQAIEQDCTNAAATYRQLIGSNGSTVQAQREYIQQANRDRAQADIDAMHENERRMNDDARQWWGTDY